jgi:hypothetical protein
MPDMNKTERPQKTPRRKRRAPYITKPNTPQATQVAIEALALTGSNNSEIARLVGVDRETVGRILTLTEMEARRSQARSVILQAVPELAGLLVQIARNKDLVAILAALRGVGVLTNKLDVESTTTNEQRSYDFPKVAFFYKHGRWPTLKEAIEFDKTLDVEPLIKESARVRPE